MKKLNGTIKIREAAKSINPDQLSDQQFNQIFISAISRLDQAKPSPRKQETSIVKQGNAKTVLLKLLKLIMLLIGLQTY